MKEINLEYSQSLFAIAYEKGMTDEYTACLKEILGIINENPAYTELLSSPALPMSERMAIIDEAFGENTEEHIVSFLKLLCEHDRIKEIGECIEGFFDLVREAQNTVTVTVRSAVELTDEQKNALADKLEEKYKKKINAIYEIDEALIGGVKVVMDDKVLDGSIEKRLQKVKEVINS